jgi:transcriptional regulator with PAS, ATPase and Fis domain
VRAIADNSFREDLFFRLNVISIVIPPLRQRKEDIPILILHFIEKYAKKRSDIKIQGIETSVVEPLMAHDYPGNVRELENIIEYAVTFAKSDRITLDDLPPAVRNVKGQRPVIHVKPLKAARFEFERSLVIAALQECNGNISKTARLLDIHRQSLQQKIKELSIHLDTVKDDVE